MRIKVEVQILLYQNPTYKRFVISKISRNMFKFNNFITQAIIHLEVQQDLETKLIDLQVKNSKKTPNAKK